MTAIISKLKSKADVQQLPVTHERAVRDDNGTTLETKLQMIDSHYNKDYEVGNGMGKKTLPKNNGVLTQAMMPLDTGQNTIYVIQYDYTLEGQTITMPANCVLEFDGGSLDNGVLIGNKTVIDAPSGKIFGNNLALFKYGYINAQAGYRDNAMVALDYAVENGTINLNKVQVNTEYFTQKGVTGKMVTDGYERASNANDNGVLSSVGSVLDVRTDLVINQTLKVEFSNGGVTMGFNNTLNGMQTISLKSTGGIFTVPVSTRFLFTDGNNNRLHPGDTHADTDLYCSYMSKLVPLVSQSTFVGGGKLSWFIGNDYAAYLSDINNAPDATVQFQKAMLCQMDIDMDINGYVRVEDSIYLETTKTIDFTGKYVWGTGVQQYNSRGNTHAERNYVQRCTIYTLNANKPLLYIRNSSINIIGGIFTVEYAAAHNKSICAIDLDYEDGGLIMDGTTFNGKKAADNSVETTCGVDFLSEGRNWGYCYEGYLNVRVFMAQVGIHFSGSVNSIIINAWVHGFYKALTGRVSMAQINFIGQASVCVPKALSDGILADFEVDGGVIDGFFWDLGSKAATDSAAAGAMVKPYGVAIVRGNCQLIGKCAYTSYSQWRQTSLLQDNYDKAYSIVPYYGAFNNRHYLCSINSIIKDNFNVTGNVYKKYDGFDTSLTATTDTPVRTQGYGQYILRLDVNAGGLEQVDDDEFVEFVLTPKTTDYMLADAMRVKGWTVVDHQFDHVQVVVDNVKQSSVTMYGNAENGSFDTDISSKISSIIIRLWGKVGGHVPRVFFWSERNTIELKTYGINQGIALAEGGFVSRSNGGVNTGNALFGFNAYWPNAITTFVNNLVTTNAPDALIMRDGQGDVWKYDSKNKKLYNQDGTKATLISRGTTNDRPSTTIQGESLDIGTQYYDTQIKKPIWWGGQDWVDALGNPVNTNYQAGITGIAGNLAGFDANGKLVDSGSKPSDFEPASA